MDDTVGAGVAGVGLPIPTNSLWLAAASLIPDIARLTGAAPERALTKVDRCYFYNHQKANVSLHIKYNSNLCVYTHRGVQTNRVLHAAATVDAFALVDVFAHLYRRKGKRCKKFISTPRLE